MYILYNYNFERRTTHKTNAAAPAYTHALVDSYRFNAILRPSSGEVRGGFFDPPLVIAKSCTLSLIHVSGVTRYFESFPTR